MPRLNAASRRRCSEYRLQAVGLLTRRVRRLKAVLQTRTRQTSAEYIITEIKRHKRGVAVILAAIILLSVAGIAYYFYFVRGGSRAAIDSIAVLPLVNTSGDPNTEYLVRRHL